MDFIEEFGIANNELDRESKEQAFFLGSEYGLIIANCIYGSHFGKKETFHFLQAFFLGSEYGLIIANCIYVKSGMFLSYQNVIHSENLPRIIQFCKRNELGIESKTLNDDFVQVLIKR